MNRSFASRATRGRTHALLRRLHCEEDGRTLLLRIGSTCVALALLSVAASAIVAYPDLKTLTSLVDSAAVTGVDNAKAHPYYGDGIMGDAPGPLTGAGVGSKAVEDLSAQPTATRLEGITIVSARAVDSRTAEVGLQARSHPPFLP